MPNLFLELRNDHDVDQYKSNFERDGFVRINRLFSDELAEQIHAVLENKTPWHLVHSTPDHTHQYYHPNVWNAKAAAERAEVFKQVSTQARDGFSYLYTCYPMIQAYLKGQDPEWPLHAMTEFLNTHEVLEFVKDITGEPECDRLDCQATKYSQGHFLNTHYDHDAGSLSNRKVAYVMSFTKDWPANWGGQLLMLDDEDTVLSGFTPTFNSLTLFKVPKRHLVTQVSSFAGHSRYSITGWLLNNVPSAPAS